jgi:hypothetical protein
MPFCGTDDGGPCVPRRARAVVACLPSISELAVEPRPHYVDNLISKTERIEITLERSAPAAKKTKEMADQAEKSYDPADKFGWKEGDIENPEARHR